MMDPRAPRLALLCALGMLGLATLAQAAETLRENELKAAFVFNFIQFTEWPPKVMETAGTLTICARNGGPVAKELAGVAGRIVNRKPLALVRLPPESVQGCHVVLVDTGDAQWVAQMGAELERAPVLLVADDNNGDIPSAMIGMAMVGRKVVFDVDAGRARRVGLGISSRVLQLARTVR